MASARIHEAIAKEINKDYNMDEILLRIGTVAPDCWRNVKKEVKDKYLTHFWDFRIKNGQANNYEEFYFKYYNQLPNPVYFGYLIHLMVDQYWKTYIDPKYSVNINGINGFKLKDGTFHDNSNLFGHFEGVKLQKKLAKEYHLGYLPTDEKDIPNFYCNIDELNLSGLFGQNGTLNYINSELSPDDKDEDSQLYDFNDILAYINETTEFIKKELNRLKKLYALLNEKFKIAIDVDDTLLFTKKLETYYWKIFVQNNSDVNPNKEYKCVDSELSRFWSEYREKMAFGKIKRATDCLDFLIDKGCIVDLITARSINKYTSLKKDLVMYFEGNGLHYHYMYLDLFSKITFLKEHNYDLLIDNDIRYIKEADSIGMITILFGPYDSSYSGYQASNWNEILPILEKILSDNKRK